MVTMGLGNCQRIGQAHCAETLNCHGDSLVQKRSFPRIGCAARRPPANLCQEMLSLVRQRTQRLNSHWTENMAGWEAAVFGRLPLWRCCRCACCLYLYYYGFKGQDHRNVFRRNYNGRRFALEDHLVKYKVLQALRDCGLLISEARPAAIALPLHAATWRPTARYSLLLPGRRLSTHLCANRLASGRSLRIIMYRFTHNYQLLRVTWNMHWWTYSASTKCDILFGCKFCAFRM